MPLHAMAQRLIEEYLTLAGHERSRRVSGTASRISIPVRKELVGDRDPRSHEFSVQLRAMDTDRSGHGLGLPVLLALCGSLMERSTKGGLIVVGSLNPGGSVEMIPNLVAVAELAVEKGAASCSCRSRREGRFLTYRTKWRPR